MQWRFSRLSLLTKILLSTSVAVTVLFALMVKVCWTVSYVSGTGVEAPKLK